MGGGGERARHPPPPFPLSSLNTLPIQWCARPRPAHPAPTTPAAATPPWATSSAATSTSSMASCTGRCEGRVGGGRERKRATTARAFKKTRPPPLVSRAHSHPAPAFPHPQTHVPCIRIGSGRPTRWTSALWPGRARCVGGRGRERGRERGSRWRPAPPLSAQQHAPLPCGGWDPPIPGPTPARAVAGVPPGDGVSVNHCTLPPSPPSLSS